MLANGEIIGYYTLTDLVPAEFAAIVLQSSPLRVILAAGNR